jgi:hypothetical protein
MSISGCTSQDPDHPITELMAHTPYSKGWLSDRFCGTKIIGYNFSSPKPEKKNNQKLCRLPAGDRVSF